MGVSFNLGADGRAFERKLEFTNALAQQMV